MPINFNLLKYKFALPWFMFDIQNKVLFTSVIIPGDMSDSKEIVLTETPIPGLNFSPIQNGGLGNRKLSFTIPVIKRNNTVGNTLVLKGFENLRQRAVGLKGIFSTKGKQFTPNPKVLYQWGTGSIPLVWYVKKLDFVHKQGFTNQLGNPTYTEVQVELWLDEENPLNKAEGMYRNLSGLAGSVTQTFDTVDSLARGGRPY